MPDTDSLLLEIHTGDVYKDMAEHAHLYDTSDFSEVVPSVQHSTANKKVFDKTKDEYPGQSIA